jgi:hypothetical protein
MQDGEAVSTFSFIVVEGATRTHTIYTIITSVTKHIIVF